MLTIAGSHTIRSPKLDRAYRVIHADICGLFHDSRPSRRVTIKLVRETLWSPIVASSNAWQRRSASLGRPVPIGLGDVGTYRAPQRR
jgi:hypothetical protein